MERPAELRDLERALDMADAKRRAVAAHHPIFHRPAPNAREVQAPWFRTMIERDGIVTLVHEGQEGIDGFIAATAFPGTPLTFRVDDFVVTRPDLWSSVGRNLLHAARREVIGRGAESWEVNCQPRDEAKREMLVAEGLVAARLNVVNHDPLPGLVERLAPASVPVRDAGWKDIDGAADLIMEQLTRYHELDATYHRPPDWEVERERLRGVMNEPGSVCLATGEIGRVRGLLLANAIPRIPVYDPGGEVYFMQSLVTQQSLWDTDGYALLLGAMRLMVERGAALMGTFALGGDAERTASLAAIGLTAVTEFFREDLSR